MKKLIIYFVLLFSSTANATLEVLVIKQEQETFPIVIAPFTAPNDTKQGKLIAKIMSDNFNRSGEFNAAAAANPITEDVDFDRWQGQKVEALVYGKIETVSEKIFTIQLYLVDTFSEKQLFAKKITVHNSGIRRIAHYLSDEIYFALLGKKGSFYTRISYVTVAKTDAGKKQYNLEIAHSDAQNPQVIFRSNSPILSPAWSPDQNKIAYVSFENGRSEVFIRYPFVRRKTDKLPYFDGISSAPSWHPDGKSLILTLSKKGNKDIYSYYLKTRKLTRLTTDDGIDTEASYSADGKQIVFTSNRSGQVQIYIKNLASGKINRATFEGSYNAKAVFSPDGKQLAMVHRVGTNYRIALLDIATKDLIIMSKNQLDESPYFSPNGSMIIFATNKNNRGVLSVASVSGQQIFNLASKKGEVREPNWSHYSK